ncbi:MAG: LuxR C-terminal-related transcriptional regulator [Muribaculum sp.]|nr:LuxR C-terminal-related transcriptional regulator [Muribaculum sp.]
MASDSLTKFAFEYYRDKDFKRFIEAGNLYSLHCFWIGDGGRALSLLDSLIALNDVEKFSKIELLRSRIGIGGQMSDWHKNVSAIRHLMQLDTIEKFQSEYKHQLYLNYSFIGKNDSALILLDELIEDAHIKNLGEQEFEYKYEKIGMLEEAGRYSESNELADYIIDNAPETSVMPFVLFWKALNYLNLGNFQAANQQLEIADRYTKDMTPEEFRYYEGFAGHIRNLLKFQNDRKIQIVPLAELSNSQRDRWFRDENTRHLQRQNALKSENRALLFKSQSERKTYIIVIVSLVALILVAGGAWLLQKRKRETVEAEERAETLQRMVDELQKTSAPSDKQEALRRAMLQQLNIIKMVAETPTEQNREMLRKISSVDNNSDGPLINWANVYEIVDNLHSGFHTKLHERYGDTITEKEVQAIVLLAAGFSAKEISVITSQSAASVYVRKSSVKKKLGVPEKEDVIAFLRKELSH